MAKLLLLMAVVGILLGLVLPALVIAGRYSHRATCANHLRVLGSAWQMYTNDFDDFLMLGFDEGLRFAWDERLVNYVDRLDAKQRASVFDCPSNPDDPGLMPASGSDYLAVFGVINKLRGRRCVARKSAEVRYPGRTVLLVEAAPHLATKDIGVVLQNSAPAMRSSFDFTRVGWWIHSGGSNFLCVDGTVVWKKAERATSGEELTFSP